MFRIHQNFPACVWEFMNATPEMTEAVKACRHKLAKLQHLLCLWESQIKT
jgi:hypothetical protein